MQLEIVKQVASEVIDDRLEKRKDEIRLAALYAEFADEDEKLPEEGMLDYQARRNTVTRFTATVLTIPFTTNLRHASLPSRVHISNDEDGLTRNFVALCHQLRALNKTRLQRKLGTVRQNALSAIEGCVLSTLGIA